MKFDVVIGNPPFQAVVGKSKTSIGTRLIKKFYNMIAPSGYMTMVCATNFMGGGQQGLGYLFTENETSYVGLNLKDHFPNIGIDVGYFLIKKIPATSEVIKIKNKSEEFFLNTKDFIYNNTNPYVPKNVDSISLPILQKIVSGKTDIFEFRSSVSKGMKHKIGFWAGGGIGIHPKYLKITNTGEFNKNEIAHACGLQKEYPQENIKSVFCGKLFHWTLNAINGNQGSDQPATLAYFPKVSLDKQWTFKELCNEFKLTDDERKVVEEWAATRKNVEWFD